jgi:cupin 2 domain-containing protein
VNLLASLPDAAAGAAEDMAVLLRRPALRIERIVSLGQASAPGFWYDQDEGEWVLLLAGAARLRFEDESEARRLAPGDCLDVAPHRRHRVDWTDPATPTIWLAVFYGGDNQADDATGQPASAAPAADAGTAPVGRAPPG